MGSAEENIEPSFQRIESVQTSLLNYMKPKQTVSINNEPSGDTTSAKKRTLTEDENATGLEPTPKKPHEVVILAPAMQQMNVNPFEIGLFYQRARIPDAEKYLAFNNCWKPDPSFVFPVSIEAGKTGHSFTLGFSSFLG